MEEDSMVEYINKILGLAPIILSQRAEALLFRIFMKYSPIPLTILSLRMESLHVVTGCPVKNNWYFLYMTPG